MGFFMIELITPAIGIVFGAIGTWITIRTYVRQLKREWQLRWDEEVKRKAEGEVKAYAAERDFNHLKNNQEQLKLAVKEIEDEVRELSQILIEIRTSHNATYHRVENLAARFDSNTGGWGKDK